VWYWWKTDIADDDTWSDRGGAMISVRTLVTDRRRCSTVLHGR